MPLKYMQRPAKVLLHRQHNSHFSYTIFNHSLDYLALLCSFIPDLRASAEIRNKLNITPTNPQHIDNDPLPPFDQDPSIIYNHILDKVSEDDDWDFNAPPGSDADLNNAAIIYNHMANTERYSPLTKQVEPLGKTASRYCHYKLRPAIYAFGFSAHIHIHSANVFANMGGSGVGDAAVAAYYPDVISPEGDNKYGISRLIISDGYGPHGSLNSFFQPDSRNPILHIAQLIGLTEAMNAPSRDMFTKNMSHRMSLFYSDIVTRVFYDHLAPVLSPNETDPEIVANALIPNLDDLIDRISHALRASNSSNFSCANIHTFDFQKYYSDRMLSLLRDHPLNTNLDDDDIDDPFVKYAL